MSERLKGKLAFVTAAGQGIGFAIVKAFLAEGASVITTDLAADERVAAVVQSTGQSLDATREAFIARHVNQRGASPPIGTLNCWSA